MNTPMASNLAACSSLHPTWVKVRVGHVTPMLMEHCIGKLIK